MRALRPTIAGDEENETHPPLSEDGADYNSVRRDKVIDHERTLI